MNFLSVGQRLGQEELWKMLMPGGKCRGLWRKGSDLLSPPSVREGRGKGLTWDLHGMGPRQVGKRTTAERNRKMAGAGRKDIE